MAKDRLPGVPTDNPHLQELAIRVAWLRSRLNSDTNIDLAVQAGKNLYESTVAIYDVEEAKNIITMIKEDENA